MPLLFSYGTLQEGPVQLSTFGRRLEGSNDELVGFEHSPVEIDDPHFVALSGKSLHANVTFNGKRDSRVSGTVFEVTDAELAAADGYEKLAGYKRIGTTLESGAQAWVYVDARTAPGATHSVPVTRFVVGALAAVLILNLILRGLLGLGGGAVTMGVSFLVAGFAAWWFAKSVRRAPTRQERSRFLWLYGGIVALPFIAIALAASLSGTPNIPGLLILFLSYIAYPAFAQMLFSDKSFAMLLRR